MFPLEDAGALGARCERGRADVRADQALGGRYLILIDDIYTDLFTGELLAPADPRRRLLGSSS